MGPGWRSHYSDWPRAGRLYLLPFASLNENTKTALFQSHNPTSLQPVEKQFSLSISALQ